VWNSFARIKSASTKGAKTNLDPKDDAYEIKISSFIENNNIYWC
jgi:hypothetical protein